MRMPTPGAGHSEGMGRARLDLVAVAAAALAVAMLFVYLMIIHQQGDQPAVWAVVILVLGAAAASYGGARDAPYRRAALLFAACGLALLGLLAILTIGMPILLSALLCVVAAVRQRPTAT